MPNRSLRTVIVALISLCPWAPTLGGTEESAAVVDVVDADETQLRHALGERFTIQSTAHFQIVQSDAWWTSRVGPLLEYTYEKFYHDFTAAGFELKPINRRLMWVCFSSRGDFEHYAAAADRMDMSWSEGYYSAKTNRVALYRSAADAQQQPEQSPAPSRVAAAVYPIDGQRLQHPLADATRASHEAAHQLAFNSGLQKRGVMYPLWAAEGLATNFEAEPDGTLELGRDNSTRRKLLLEAAGDGRLRPLSDFIVIARIPAQSASATADLYAQCWGTFQFLMKRHPENLRRYMSAMKGLEIGYRDEADLRREFTEAFGDVGAMEKSWREFLGDIGRGKAGAQKSGR